MRVLLFYNLFLGPYLVLILDNYVVYKYISVLKIYKEVGVKLVFLPLYSPDFNLIKYLFNILKIKIKKYISLTE